MRALLQVQRTHLMDTAPFHDDDGDDNNASTISRRF